jgi:acetolactate synthase-1/2/3 large subunit
VHLDIPHDVLSMPCTWHDDESDLPPSRYRSLHRPRPAAAAVAEAVRLLQRAQRPLIVAGGAVVRAGADAAVPTLAARLGAP